MEKGTEIISNSFLNLDFIYYMIYLFFKSVVNFFIPSQEDGIINFFNVWKYTTDGSVVINPDEYSKYGEGIAALYDGYSLFTPPHGLTEFGGFSGWIDNFFTNPYCSECLSFSDLFFGGLNILFYILFFLGLFVLIYLKKKNEFLLEKETILYDKVYEREVIKKGNKKNEKWENILSLLESTNQNDWKAAIIDSDNFLEEALEENKFYGENIGDRLKKADFSTIQNAWSGHRVRNQIAHDPDFNLTHREAKSAVANFLQVFNEFYH